MTYEDFKWVRSELSERMHRMEVYQDDLSRRDLLAWLKDLDSTLGDYDDMHSGCVSYDRESELVSEVEEKDARISELEAEVDRLEGLKNPKTLKAKIQKLEGELSDARADIAVYNERVQKGLTHMVLAENFAFTPEEARAQFRAIPGGAA